MKNDFLLKWIISVILITVFGAWFLNCDMPKKIYFTDLSEYQDEDKSQTPVLNLPKGHYEIALEYSSILDAELTIYKDDYSPLFLSLPATGGEVVPYNVSVDLEQGYDYFRLSVNNRGENNISFNSFLLESTRPLYFDKLIILAISIIILFTWFCLAFIYDKTDSSIYKKINSRLNIDSFSILVLLLAFIIASIPCFYRSITNTTGQDLICHLSRIEGIKDGLSTGQLPVFLYPESYWGFGVTGVIYPGTFSYIPALIRLLLHSSAVLSWNIFLILVNITTLISMYYCINAVTNKNKLLSTVATVLYLLAPYRLNNMYVRSAVGEALAMAFFPLIVAGLYLIFCNNSENKYKNYFPLVIGLTCTLRSHLISIVYAAVICVVFGLIFIKEALKRETLLAILKAFILTILMCSSFLISYVCFMHSNKLNLSELNRKLYRTALSFTDLFKIVPSTLEGNDSLTTFHSLSIIGLILFVLLIIIIFKNSLNKNSIAINNTVIFAVTSSLLAFIFTFLSTKYTPWRMLHSISLLDSILTKFQFPWRFLSLASLFILVSIAMIVNSLYDEFSNNTILFSMSKYSVITAIVIIASVVSVIPLYAMLSKTTKRVTKVSGAITEGRMDEYLPFTDSVDQTWAYRSYATLSDYDAISAGDYNKRYSTISFSYSASKDDLYIDLPLTYYSEYKAFELDSNDNRIDLKTGLGKYETLRVYINKHEEMRPVLILYSVPAYAYIGIIISLAGCILFYITLRKE